MKEKHRFTGLASQACLFMQRTVEKGGIASMHSSSRPCLTLQMPAVQEVSTASSAWLPCPAL